ncbi:MAG: septum formation initiator family protein [bacterium]
MQNNSISKKKTNKIYRKRIYYLFLTFILMICLFQVLRGVYLNIAKYFVLNKQLNKLENLNLAVIEKNKNLKIQLKNYTSSKGIEALARDNLHMVGKDEVLVIIKESPLLQKENKNKS